MSTVNKTVIDQDGTTYISINEFCKVRGINRMRAMDMLKGKRKACKGFSIKFVGEYFDVTSK